MMCVPPASGGMARPRPSCAGCSDRRCRRRGARRACRAWRATTAMFTDTVDFPTPPLPLDIARMRPSFGYATGVGAGTAAFRDCGSCPITGRERPAWGAGGFGVAAAADFCSDGSFTSTRTSVTPSTLSTAWRASRTSDAGSRASSSIVKRTRPSRVRPTSRTICDATTSSPVRGLTTLSSAAEMRACRGSAIRRRSGDLGDVHLADLRHAPAQVRFDAGAEHGHAHVGSLGRNRRCGSRRARWRCRSGRARARRRPCEAAAAWR